MAGAPSGSLRARLTLVLSLVVLLSGAAVVVGVYLVAAQEVRSGAELSDAEFDDLMARIEGPSTSGEACEGQEDITCSRVGDGTADSGGTAADGDDTAVETSISVVAVVSVIRTAEAVRSMVIRSVLIVLLFSAVTIVVIWWVLRRSFRRLEVATRRARAIDDEHLALRLLIDGPRDEVRELGDTVDSVLDRLVEVLNAQRRFVANASHELRTPLAVARTALDIPLEQGRVPAELRPAVRSALSATQRAAELLDALLLLARTGADGDLGERADHLDLAETVRQVLDESPPGRTVHTDLHPAVVLADPTMMHQVVANLVGNADHHNHDGGEIWVRTRSEDGWGALEVSNDGGRFSAQTVRSWCEPFHRGDRSRLSRGEHAGMGLGLSIVAAVAARHEGTLDLAPRAEGGLRVRFRVPAAPTLPDRDTAGVPAAGR